MKIGPRPELEAGVALVVHQRAGDVGRQQVGRELDAARSRCPSACENERAISVLARPGHVLEQHVPVGQHAEQHELQHLALADDRALDLVEQRGGPLAGLVQGQVGRPRRSSCGGTPGVHAVQVVEQARQLGARAGVVGGRRRRWRRARRRAPGARALGLERRRRPRRARAGGGQAAARAAAAAARRARVRRRSASSTSRSSRSRSGGPGDRRAPRRERAGERRAVGARQAGRAADEGDQGRGEGQGGLAEQQGAVAGRAAGRAAARRRSSASITARSSWSPRPPRARHGLRRRRSAASWSRTSARRAIASCRIASLTGCVAEARALEQAGQALGAGPGDVVRAQHARHELAGRVGGRRHAGRASDQSRVQAVVAGEHGEPRDPRSARSPPGRASSSAVRASRSPSGAAARRRRQLT